MTRVKVRIADERIDELEREIDEALGGAWYIRLSVPEVALLVAAYRESLSATESAESSAA